jgi:hypothetical protein
MAERDSVNIFAPLVHGVSGSHQTLLATLLSTLALRQFMSITSRTHHKP